MPPLDIGASVRFRLTDEYLRVWRLILSGDKMPNADSGGSIFSSENATGYGALGYQDGWTHYNAAGLRIHFTVTQATSQTPNTAEITIYNLDGEISSRVIQENGFCILQAGYLYGNPGTIFSGTIKQYKRGHESPTDSYLKIYAADGDGPLTEATISKVIPEGTDPKQHMEALKDPLKAKGMLEGGYVDLGAVVRPPNIRPEIHFGMAATSMGIFAKQNGAVWHILNQRFHFTKPEKYEPGAIIKLHEGSGLIGFPEMTQDGINVTALINPAIRLRHRIQLDNSYINTYYLPGKSQVGGTFAPNDKTLQGAAWPGYARTYYARTYDNGIYSPWQINYEGDSRGGPWYMHMICLSVNPANDPISAMVGALSYSRL